jgi:hypothetical protein
MPIYILSSKTQYFKNILNIQINIQITLIIIINQYWTMYLIKYFPHSYPIDYFYIILISFKLN